MSIDYNILASLANPITKQILHSVVKGKAVRLRQLISDQVTQEQALQALDILRDAELIKETSAPINELKTFYVTASGLQVDRMVKG